MSERWNKGVVGTEVLPLINLDKKIIRVEAGPGTGKTFGLVRRVQRILHPDGLAVPGDTLLFTAKIDQLTEQFAVTAGEVSLRRPSSDPEKCESRHLASIELIFSNLDQNLAGKKFPEQQFILTDLFQILLRDILPTTGKRVGDKTSEQACLNGE